jgi:hypothetical protein
MEADEILGTEVVPRDGKKKGMVLHARQAMRLGAIHTAAILKACVYQEIVAGEHCSSSVVLG